MMCVFFFLQPTVTLSLIRRSDPIAALNLIQLAARKSGTRDVHVCAGFYFRRASSNRTLHKTSNTNASTSKAEQSSCGTSFRLLFCAPLRYNGRQCCARCTTTNSVCCTRDSATLGWCGEGGNGKQSRPSRPSISAQKHGTTTQSANPRKG